MYSDAPNSQSWKQYNYCPSTEPWLNEAENTQRERRIKLWCGSVLPDNRKSPWQSVKWKMKVAKQHAEYDTIALPVRACVRVLICVGKISRQRHQNVMPVILSSRIWGDFCFLVYTFHSICIDSMCNKFKNFKVSSPSGETLPWSRPLPFMILSPHRTLVSSENQPQT